MKIPLHARQSCCFSYALLHVAAHFSAKWFEVMPGISIWYVPCGLALGLLLLLGPSYWPMVLALNVLTAYLGGGLPEWWAPLLFPILLTANYTFFAWLGRRIFGPVLIPATPKSVSSFVLLLLLAPAVASFSGSFVLWLLGLQSPETLLPATLRWWVGDFCGLLTVVPAALVFGGPLVRNEKHPVGSMGKLSHHWLRILAQGAALLLTLVLVYSIESLRRYNAFYVCFLPLIWICLDHGLPGATLATLAVMMSGLVSMHFFGDASHELVINFLLFVIAVVGVGLGLGSAVSARNYVQQRFLRAQKMESLGVLAGGIAHDFNNLLTVVLGNATLAKLDAGDNAAVQTSLDQIETATRKASELCQQMLVYAGKAPLSKAHINLHDLAERSLGLVGSSVSKQCRLVVLPPAGLATILADENQLQQVLVILLLNASEAVGMKDGKVIIRTDSRHFLRHDLTHHLADHPLQEGMYAVLEVEDNGVGMSPEVLSRLFEPFFSTKFIGKGLGLAAVLGIVKANGGGISVRSSQGEGSCFQLVFPFASSASAQSARRPLSAPSRPRRRTGVVLVVDDDAAVRAVIVRSLKNLGYEILEASDGLEALEVYGRDHPRLRCVITDVVMPRMDGVAAMSEMRRINPNVPVVLMSAYDAKEKLAGMGLQSGTVFLSKPFDMAFLDEQLSGLLDKSASA